MVLSSWIFIATFLFFPWASPPASDFDVQKQKLQMSEVAAAPSCRAALVSGGLPRFKRDSVISSPKWQCNVKQLKVLKIEAQTAKPSTYSSRISTDIPLYEIPGVKIPPFFISLSLSLCDGFDLVFEFWNGQASFDQYLEDKPRVFKAIFPDKRRSSQINEVYFLDFFVSFLFGFWCGIC